MIVFREIWSDVMEAMRDLWAQRLFRFIVYVDIFGLAVVAIILGACYFDGKIGLLK
jgi:hypothetical protein